MNCDGWVICCSVKNGTYTNCRRVSADPLHKKLIIDEVKRLACGAWLVKVALIGLEGVNTGFYLNADRIANIITRFDLKGDDNNWLKFSPSTSRIIRCDTGKTFGVDKWAYGEHNSENIPHGKVIYIVPDYGSIKNSYFKIENYHNGLRTSGNFIEIPARSASAYLG